MQPKLVFPINSIQHLLVARSAALMAGLIKAYARSVVARGSANTTGGGYTAKRAAVRDCASTARRRGIARSVAAETCAHTVEYGELAKSAVALGSASTAGGRNVARRGVVVMRSASTGGGRNVARTAVVMRSASTRGASIRAGYAKRRSCVRVWGRILMNLKQGRMQGLVLFPLFSK